jgi:hypothetical protein
VSPPFGSVLITVLSAPMPFTETSDRPPFELASAYLLRVREALAASKNSERLIADFVFLQTVLAMTALPCSPTHFFWLLLALCLLGFGLLYAVGARRGPRRAAACGAAAHRDARCAGAADEAAVEALRESMAQARQALRRRRRGPHGRAPARRAVVPVLRRCGGRPAGAAGHRAGQRLPAAEQRRRRSVQRPAGAGG